MADFRDNAAERRYELDHVGGPSFARYAQRDGVRLILHVETPAAARGNGHAEALMRAIVDEARASGRKLTPLCSYAVAYARRHNEARDVFA